MSELGPEGFSKFATAKQSTSWMRLAPNNKISGGRVLSNRLPKGSNRIKIALKQAVNAIGNLKDTHLSDFFKRVAYLFSGHKRSSGSSKCNSPETCSHNLDNDYT